MARSRNIKPALFQNEDLAECGPLGMILFTGLWCHADREGRLADRPKRIKIQVLPYFEADCDALLTCLEKTGFIQRYEADNHKYIQILSFSKHQNPHVNEVKSTIPAPYNDGTTPVKQGSTRADSLNPLTDSLKETGTAKRGTRLPNDWELPDEWLTWALEHRNDLDVKLIAESFKDYWISVTGAKGTKLDWFATWRNWVRRETANENKRKTGGQSAVGRARAANPNGAD